MNADAVKAALIRATRQAWPKVTKASDLPFPEYWRKQTEFLTFHAPHVGDTLMDQLIEEAVQIALDAERSGTEPKPWEVSARVREIWEKVASGRKQDEKREAWDNAALRAAAVKDRMAQRSLI